MNIIKKLFAKKPKTCVHGFTENEIVGSFHNKTHPQCDKCGELIDIAKEAAK